MMPSNRSEIGEPGRLVVVCAVMFALHYWVTPEVRIFGVRPEIIVGLPVAIGFLAGAEAGALAGLVAGLSVDLLGGETAGLGALSYFAAGYLVGLVSEDASGHAMVSALFAILGSIIAVVSYGLAGNLAGALDVGLRRLVQVAVWVALVNALIAPLLVRVLRPRVSYGRST